MAFHDPDKVNAPDPAAAREREERAAKAKEYAATQAAFMAGLLAKHEARELFAGEGFEVAFPGDRLDGSPCPEGARFVAPVAGARFGQVWVSIIRDGEIVEVVVCPKDKAGAARKAAYSE